MRRHCSRPGGAVSRLSSSTMVTSSGSSEDDKESSLLYTPWWSCERPWYCNIITATTGVASVAVRSRRVFVRTASHCHTAPPRDGAAVNSQILGGDYPTTGTAAVMRAAVLTGSGNWGHGWHCLGHCVGGWTAQGGRERGTAARRASGSETRPEAEDGGGEGAEASRGRGRGQGRLGGGSRQTKQASRGAGR